MPDVGGKAARLANLFGISLDAARVAVGRMETAQPPHLFDGALCCAARRGGEEFGRIEVEVSALPREYQTAVLMERAVLVSYKVLRALRDVGSPRSFIFAEEDEGEDFAELGDPLPELEHERRSMEKLFLGRLADRERFTMNTGEHFAESERGPVVLNWHSTAGMSLQGLPELACFMVDRHLARGIFLDVARWLRDRGGNIPLGRRLPKVLEQGEVALIRVSASNMRSRFDTATRVLGSGFRGMQVVLADPHGRLPWDGGCERDYSVTQPLLGVVPRRNTH